MSSAVNLIVADLSIGAVVVDAWLGQSGVVTAARTTLGRAPDHEEMGGECRLSPEQVLAIVEAGYVGAPAESEVQGWLQRFAPDSHSWCILHSY